MEDNMRKIDGFEDYLIDENGRVWSSKRSIFLKHSSNKGYQFVQLYKNGKGENILVHRLVALAFIPNPENKKTVNHKNGNKADNRLQNLEWNTQAENAQHSWKMGLQIYSEAAHKANRREVICIETNKVFSSAAAASRSLGFTDRAVSMAIHQNCKAGGFTWKYKE